MAKRESIQEKIKRIRPPRVHITYNVETQGASVVKELPFVVGVLADLSGRNKTDKDKRFVNIDRDNFNDVLKKVNPQLAFRVKNTLGEGESKLGQNLAARTGSRDNAGESTIGVELSFEHIKDFEPDGLVKQIEPLHKLVQARKALSDLLARMDGNDRLEELLRQVLESTEAQRELSAALGIKEESNG